MFSINQITGLLSHAFIIINVILKNASKLRNQNNTTHEAAYTNSLTEHM